MWWKSSYVKLLEANVKKLESQLAAYRSENQRLVNRLLLKSGVPLAEHIELPVDPREVEKLLMGGSIFDDLDDIKDEVGITDNRKAEKFDDLF